MLDCACHFLLTDDLQHDCPATPAGMLVNKTLPYLLLLPRCYKEN
jgi:hypothetical protein